MYIVLFFSVNLDHHQRFPTPLHREQSLKRHQYDAVEANEHPAAALLQYPPPPPSVLSPLRRHRLQVRPRRVLQQRILDRNLPPAPRRRDRRRERRRHEVLQAGVADAPESNHLVRRARKRLAVEVMERRGAGI